MYAIVRSGGRQHKVAVDDIVEIDKVSAEVGEKVELTPSARVNGNVHYQVVEMNAGAQLNGRLIHASAPMAALPAPEGDEANGSKGDTAARRKLAEAMA